MTKSIADIVTELGQRLDAFFPEQSDNIATIDTPSGRPLVVMGKASYEALLADALAWRAMTRDQPKSMSPDEVMALFGKPDAT